MRPLSFKRWLLDHILKIYLPFFSFLHPLMTLASSTSQSENSPWQKNNAPTSLPRYDQWPNFDVSTHLPKLNFLLPKLNLPAQLSDFSRLPNPTNTFTQPPSFTVKSQLNNIPAQSSRFTPQQTQLPIFNLNSVTSVPFWHPTLQRKPDSNLSIKPPSLSRTLGPYIPTQRPKNTSLPSSLPNFTLNPGPYLPIWPPGVKQEPDSISPIQRKKYTLKPKPNISIHLPTFNPNSGSYLPKQHPGFTLKPEPNLPLQLPKYTIKPEINIPFKPPMVHSKLESNIPVYHPRYTLKPNLNTSAHLPKYIQRSRPNNSIKVPRYSSWPKPVEYPVHFPKLNLWPWIPLNTPAPVPDKHHSQPNPLLPDHNFWPLVPVKNPRDDKNERENVKSKLPTHNFWPFIPVLPPRNHSLKPTPAPPPTKKPFPSTPNRYNYGEVMYKSILFYEVQRSGWLPNDRKIKWRSHSALGDQGFRGEDLSGGWYDAGDYVKFGTPMATAASMLLWGLVEYPDAYKSTGLYNDVLASVKWPLDYFLKAHCSKYELYGQIGDPYIDHTYWGRPEDMEMERPAYKLTPSQPGSDLAADTASAMALGYLAFKLVDLPYAKRLLEHAIELFEFADFYRGGYTQSIQNAWEFYRSYTDEDELAWAAIWLYRATLNVHYLNRAKYYYDRMDECWAQSWADKSCSVPVLMYQMTKGARFKSKVESIMSQWSPGGEVDYTSKGLAFRGPWGTLRYTANMAFIAMRAADLDIRPATYRNWARSQIHYMLGDGGRSYVVGYGHNPPTRPHHAASSCESPPEPCTWEDYTKPEPNAHTLFGALVGGPDLSDNFVDSRSDYIHNEVGCEYNAGFQSSLAALKSLELQMTP